MFWSIMNDTNHSTRVRAPASSPATGVRAHSLRASMTSGTQSPFRDGSRPMLGTQARSTIRPSIYVTVCGLPHGMSYHSATLAMWQLWQEKWIATRWYWLVSRKRGFQEAIIGVLKVSRCCTRVTQAERLVLHYCCTDPFNTLWYPGH